MDRLRCWLVGAAAPAALTCALVAVSPLPDVVGDLAVALLGLAAAALLWCVGRRRQAGARGWRLIAVAPLLPVVGFAAAALLQPTDPGTLVVVRWLPTIPGYLLAVAGVLTLVDRARLRSGARAAVELALFGVACVLVVQLLALGPGRTWTALGPGVALTLLAAVVVTSATMAAALVVLGAIESRRQPMALVLLGGAVLLATGRALGTSALLSGALGVGDVSRLLVVGGLTLLGVAVLVDPGPSTGPDGRSRPRSGRSTTLGQVLPHAAMTCAVLVPASASLLGHRPGPVAGAGAVVCVLLAAGHRWVTARDEQRLGARLRRSEAYFRSLVASGGDAVLILDGDLRVTWASPALDGVLARDASRCVVGAELLDLVHPEDALPLARALQPGPAGRCAGVLVVRLAHADGGWRSLEAGVSDLREDADVGAVVLHCRDITARLERERALEEVAFTDRLTGLPNRAGFLRVLEDAGPPPATGGREPAPRSLLLVELVGLDDVREHAGRDEITRVLVEIGRRLRATVRGGELVARLGGGAFAVLADGTGSPADLLADRCLSVIEQPLTTRAGIFDLTANVGVVAVGTGTPVADLLARAELAVRAAAADGPGTAVRYRPALGDAALRRDQLREALPGAWQRGEMEVLYQPVVSLHEQQVTGVEALLRWRHPELGEVPPAEFVPIAERAGVIGELQRWALERATEAVLVLPGTGAPLRLGVNISSAHVAARTLVGDVAAVLRSSGLSAERLILEITEDTVLADSEAVAVDVEALRLMGVHVALDDFGTGRSSLTPLTRLPIDVLKLDRAFVARVDRDPRARALCESVVAIGRALGLDIVAEGVETPAQLGTLRGLGCDFAQGFLLSRPLRAAELGALLAGGTGVFWPGMVGTR